MYSIKKGVKTINDSISEKIIEKTKYKYKTSCQGAVLYYNFFNEKTIIYDSLGHIKNTSRKYRKNYNSQSYE